MNCSELRLSLLQTDIRWEDKTENLSHIETEIRKLAGHTDLAVLPEMCTTGFTMHSRELAESVDGPTLQRLLSLSSASHTALAGSFICREEDAFYNRAFLLTPQGDCHFYDKRHLFRMGGEDRSFSAGINRPVFTYKGWNILLQVCYDLRFPVWSRNRGCEYDLALYVANWPASRIRVWETLLAARSIENQAYVCGVNRVGKDGEGILYNGHSLLFNAKGEPLVSLDQSTETLCTVQIDKDSLLQFREKFPVWKDAD